MSSKWRVIYNSPDRGASNMAIDEAIMLAVSEGASPPTLRFYAWDPPTVSIGYFQRLEREIDLVKVSEAGYDLVRRPTGGRTVLHDDEVTYSIIVREAEFRGSVVETYRRISTGLVEGLRALGIEAGMVAAQEAGHDPREHSSAACFDSPRSDGEAGLFVLTKTGPHSSDSPACARVQPHGLGGARSCIL